MADLHTGGLFNIWQGNFRDILTDSKANDAISDFVARKIRERVKNHAVAEKLIPKKSWVRHTPDPDGNALLRGLQPAKCQIGRHKGNADRADHGHSWMTGISTSVEGRQTRIIARYSGSAPAYRARCEEVAAQGYQQLELA